jgi:O-antigen ligase
MAQLSIVYGMYLGMAFAFGIACIVALAVTLQIYRTKRDWFAPLLFVLLGTGIAASTLMSGRDLKYASLGAILSDGQVSLAAFVWGLRLLTITIVGLSLGTVLGALLARKSTTDHVPANPLLLITFLLFFVSTTVFNALLGTQPDFVHNAYYAGLLFLSLYYCLKPTGWAPIDAAKWTLHGLMVISLAAAVVKPSLALQPDYAGLLPGIRFRLWGVGSHANSIGPLALVALMLEYLRPSRLLVLRAAACLAAILVLLLAQSKTVWLAGLLIFVFLPVFRANWASQQRLALFTVATLVAAAGILLAGFLGPALFEKAVATRGLTGGDFESLSGRAKIWEASLSEWVANPWFGYGPGLWGLEHRLSVGLPAVTSAHNQFLQTLSGAGNIGVAGLLVYLAVLARWSARAAGQTKGVSLALYVLILVRCLTETPLVFGTLFNAELITHALLFALVIVGAKEGKVASAAAGLDASWRRFAGTRPPTVQV